MRIIGLLLISLLVAGCWEEEAPPPEVIRGLKAYRVAETESSSTRRFPAVLEPASLSVLSFEIGGKLGELNLGVGQRVAAGEVVASLDTASLTLQVQNARAGVAQADASARNAADALARQEALFERGSTTKVAVDDARTKATSAAAALVQAEKALETAQENLGKADLHAPFDGIVNSVDANSFATVSAGTPIASIYSPDAFEVAFSVNFDIVNQLVVGTLAEIRLADRPDIALQAVVSEIGSRADAVSSFPIVVELRETHPLLKAGMAVEAAISFPLPAEQGFVVPLSAIIKDGSGDPGNTRMAGRGYVFVYDAASETVKRREVLIGGVRDNALLVVDGLQPGDLVASAGVSFLKEGQKVKLLPVANGDGA